MAKKVKAIERVLLTVEDTQVEPGAGGPEREGSAAPGETDAAPRMKRYRVLVKGATAICGGGGQVYPVGPSIEGEYGAVELPAGETWYAAMVEGGQLVRVEP